MLRSIKAPSRKLLISTLFALCISYFCFHMVHGDRSLFTLMRLSKQVQQQEISLAALHEEQLNIENRVSRLRETSLDLDLLDERARYSLGYAKPHEVMHIIR